MLGWKVLFWTIVIYVLFTFIYFFVKRGKYTITKNLLRDLRQYIFGYMELEKLYIEKMFESGIENDLSKIEIRKNITDDSKYDYLFSVDTLNQEVLSGKPFRDAYRDLGAAIEKGKFKPNRSVTHTHIGSVGNLGLKRIREKMKTLFS